MKADRMFRFGVKAVVREVKQINPVKFSCVQARVSTVGRRPACH